MDVSYPLRVLAVCVRPLRSKRLLQKVSRKALWRVKDRTGSLYNFVRVVSIDGSANKRPGLRAQKR